MIKGKNRGQSTLEYVLLVTAVIVVVIGMVASPSSPFRTKLNSTLSEAVNLMDDNVGKIGGRS
ncbi:MAG: class III signal peptide-containing protein [Candidatus Omnitrophota bacterium]